MAELKTKPRFPDVPAGAGHYESFFLKGGKPSEGLAFWIRHTVHKRPGDRAVGSIWFTFFDASADGPVASKRTFPPDELGTGPDHYIHVGESRFEPGRAVGSARSDQLDASWELELDSPEEPYHHLPREWMYRARLPRTKLLSPYPSARYRGRLTVGGRQVEVDGWPGTVGHNWGAQHAERWIWMHGAELDGGGEPAWLDAALGRIKLGPVTTPWVGNARLWLDGRRLTLGGPGRVRGTTVTESPSRCEFVLPGDGVTVRGEVGSERKNFVGWVYSDPDGSEHNTVNCSIADMTLVVTRDGQPDLRLTGSACAAYELGMRERDHGVPLQPFPDP